jgi:hypothetical protein
MKRIFAAATLAATLLIAAPASAAWEETRTVWPTTQTYYNTCNDEVVLLNADYTEVVRQKVEAGRMRYQVTGWLSNVRANDTASGREYSVQSANAFLLDSREDKGYSRTTQMEILRLKPKDAAAGKQTLMVTTTRRLAVNTVTGQELPPVESYKTACV